MKRLIKALIVTLSTTLGQVAVANELEWRLVSAASRGIGGISCDKNSVELTSAGTDVSLIMKNMNISMPAGEFPRLKYQWGTCFVHLSVKIPQGFTIKSNQTSLMGGILKDKGPTGYLDVVTTFNQRRPLGMSPFVLGASPIGPVTNIYRALKYKDEIDEPLFDLTRTVSFSNSQKISLCRLTAKQPAEIGYFVQLSLAASRSNSQQNAIVNIDNLDGHFTMQTSVEACPRI
jgi:hypothetical protein